MRLQLLLCCLIAVPLAFGASQQIFYESSTTNYTSTAQINLSTNDGTENTVSFTVPAQSFSTAVNATITMNGSGMQIHGTTVNFTGWFEQPNNNAFYATWKLYKENATSTLICQSGDDGLGGTDLGDRSKKPVNGSCSAPATRVYGGDNLTLVVNLYNSANGQDKDFTHYWENTSDSLVQFRATKLGSLTVELPNLSARTVDEHTDFVEYCNVSCTDGSCVNTNVSIEYYNGTGWEILPGNVTVNDTQQNPVLLGNITSNQTVRFGLFGETASRNNTIRCAADSTYVSTFSSPKNITIQDVTPPNVTLFGNNSNHSQDVLLSYRPTDWHLDNCTLWGNFSGPWEANQTNTTPTNASTNTFSVDLDFGTYLWNVYCTDESGNTAFGQNFTFTVTGDVHINLTLSNPTPVEDETITLTANVTNNANRTETVLVQFWNGHPDDGGTQLGDDTIIVQSLSWNTTTYDYTVPLGTHNLWALADPDNTITEYDETNNEDNQTITIAIWQLYYGNATGNLTLATSGNATISAWVPVTRKGNVYVSDSDAIDGITFTELKPFGENISGGTNPNTADDFENLDQLINTSQFTDSVNRSYTLGDTIRATDVFRIFGVNQTVPIINSTASGNFTTGLLWDSSDSSDAHYDTTDKEDVVFITAVREQVDTTSGIVDYEIRIPSRLINYKGTEGTVSLYYEIQ